MMGNIVNKKRKTNNDFEELFMMIYTQLPEKRAHLSNIV